MKWTSQIRIAFLFVAVTITGCGSPSVEGDKTGASATPAEIHQTQEEAIASCMQKQGFDYKAVTFIDDGIERDSGDYLNVRLNGAEDVGYASVFDSLVELTTSTGAPPAELSGREVAAYDRALVGEHPHGHAGSDEEHTHEVAGCQKVGIEAIEKLKKAPDFTTEPGDELTFLFSEKLQASPNFGTFQETWNDCISKAGFESRDANPLVHSDLARNHYYEASETHLLRDNQDPSSNKAISDTYGVVADSKSFDAALSLDEDLNAIFNEESKEAVQDQLCREESWETIADDFDAIADDVFGNAGF